MLPETTEKKEGFIVFQSSESGFERAVVKGLVRDHDLAKLHKMEKFLEAIVAQKRMQYPDAEIALEFREQYRNMKQVLDKHPLVMKYALDAMRAEGIEPILKPVRGGTDGARLSFMGLPTPNIFIGGGNFHGRSEWVSLDGMEKAAKVLIALARKWEENS
jgi:tripeptide aminopeptidase